MPCLVERLGYLPLALVQAGSYMRKTSTSCQKYLKLYENSWSDLVAEDPKVREYQNGSIENTWMISYHRVRETNPAAAKLLQLWAYLDHRNIWMELLLPASRYIQDYPLLSSLTRDEISFKSIMQSLLEYSLVESPGQDESYSMHPVVHDWCSKTIGHGQFDMMRLAFSIIGSAIPYDIDHQRTWALERRLLPHANHCIEQFDRCKAWGDLDHLDCEAKILRIGKLYALQNELGKAENLYRQAIDGKQGVLAAHDPYMISLACRLGDVYSRQGRNNEAEDILRRALDKMIDRSGSNLYLYISICTSLSSIYIVQDDFFNAEKILQSVLHVAETAELLGTPILSMSWVHALGFLYEKQGRSAEAVKVLRKGFDKIEKAMNFRDRATQSVIRKLAQLLQAQGRILEAEKVLQRGMDWNAKALGYDHSFTTSMLVDLVAFYQIRGKIAEAEELLQRTVDKLEGSLDHDNPVLLKVLMMLAELYVSQGMSIGTEERMRRVVDLLKTTDYYDDGRVIRIRFHLAMSYKAQGRQHDVEEVVWDFMWCGKCGAFLTDHP